VADLLVAALSMLAPAAADLLRHLGPAHGFERFLVFVVAFGPFVVLAVVAVVVRRREAREQEDPRPEA
jgi:hypothetical protein